MAMPEADGAPLEGFVAADDPDAKTTAMAIVEAVGFEPVDVGLLSRARQLEALAIPEHGHPGRTAGADQRSGASSAK